MAKDGLNPRQEAFCLAYAASGNATEAYKKAGYKARTENAASVEAHRNLRKPKIQKRLKELAAKVESAKVMDLEEIQQRLSAIARQDLTEEVITEKGQRMRKEAGLKESLKAMELLGKMKGAFLDRQQLEVSGAIPVVIRDDL